MGLLRGFCGLMVFGSIVGFIWPEVWNANMSAGNARLSAAATFVVASIVGAWAQSRIDRRY